MNRYQHYPVRLAAAASRPSRAKAVSAMVEDGNPADHLERLRLHPAILSLLLLDGSLSFDVFMQYPELLAPALRAATDKTAFVALAFDVLGGATEGMLEEYVLIARRAGVMDSLLASAFERIQSPWRLHGLGYHKRADAIRNERPDDVRVRFSEYLMSGKYRTDEEFADAEQLAVEDVWEYVSLRLRTSPRKEVKLALLERAGPQLAFNLIVPPEPVVSPSNTPILIIWEVVGSVLSDPIWSTEYLLAKAHGQDPDSPAMETEAVLWLPDRDFTCVPSQQLREEIGSILN